MSYSHLKDRHQKFMENAMMSNPALSINDRNILVKEHKFVRDDEQDRKMCTQSWEIRMARRYYDKLFKEYALVDLSRYKENKIGMRWRNKIEVIEGKGQFSCGNTSCYMDSDLLTYEVPFKYVEDATLKHELVKVRLCEECAKQLFYQKLRAMKKSFKQKSSLDDAGPDAKKLRRVEAVDNETPPTNTHALGSLHKEHVPHHDTQVNESHGNSWSNPLELTTKQSEQERMASYFDDLLL